jgi:predicted Fe-Mo cluster-binding NifX family protein
VKIAVTARGPHPDCEIDESFGRAYWFLLFEEEWSSWEPVDNQEIRKALNNAGQMACELLREYGVDVLITGETGPKAFRCLSAAGIAVYHGAAGTVQETLQAWAEGRLELAGQANSKGSPYCLIGSACCDTPVAVVPKLALVRAY